MRKELYNMFRWSLSKAMDNHPEEVINMGECKFIISQVWEDMVKDGDIHIVNEK